MSLTDLRDTIVGLTDDQVARVNKNDERVICNKDQGEMSNEDRTEADNVHSDIEELSVSDFNTLNGMLPANRKLNHDPC